MISYKAVSEADWYDWNKLAQAAREKAAQEVVNSFWIPHARAFRNYQCLSINQKINRKIKGNRLFAERLKILGLIKNPNYFLASIYENHCYFTAEGEFIWFSTSPPPDDLERDALVAQNHLKEISSYEYDHRRRKAVKSRSQ